MNNICKDITCERLNNCPYENEEILYCPGYLNTTKIESAWEMFRRLWKKYGIKFFSRLNILIKGDSKRNIIYWIVDTIEVEAMKIMQRIEKEFKK